MSWPESEQDVAAPMVEYLRAHDWEVFQEVPLPSGRVDIVARRHGLYHGLEVKRHYGFSVLDQAIYNATYFHYASVVVPRLKRSYGGRGGHAARIVHRQTGVGLWVTHPDREPVVRQDPKLQRPPGHRVERIEENLYEAQKHYEGAGSSSGTYWSSWRENCRRVREHVEQHPGCTMEDLLDAIDHHYSADSTFKSCVRQDVKAGKIDGVRLEQAATDRFYPTNGDRGSEDVG